MSSWGSYFFSSAKTAEPVVPVEPEGVTARPSPSQPPKSLPVAGTIQKDTISIQRTTSTARKKLYDSPAIPKDSKFPFPPPATSNSNAGRVAKLFGYATPDPVPSSTPASDVKPTPTPITTPAPAPVQVEIKAVAAPKPKPEPPKPTEVPAPAPAPAPNAGRIAKLFGYGTSKPAPAATTAESTTIKPDPNLPPKAAPAITPKEVTPTPPTKPEPKPEPEPKLPIPKLPIPKLPMQTPIPTSLNPTETIQAPNPNAERLANLFGYASPPSAPAAPVPEVQFEEKAQTVGVIEERISPTQTIALAKFEREKDLKDLNGDGERPVILRANTLPERSTSQPYTPNPRHRTRGGRSASSAEIKLFMSNREVQASQEESLYRERRIREHQRQAERIAVQKEMMEIERRRIMEESEKWREQEQKWREEEEEMRRFVEEVKREREREELEEEERRRSERVVRDKSVERAGGGGGRIPGAFDEESGFGDPAIQDGRRDRNNRDDDRVSKKEAERSKRLNEYEEQVEAERLRYEEEEAEERAQRRREEQEEERLRQEEEEAERLREEQEEEARAQKRRNDRIAKEKRQAEKERQEQLRYEQEEAEEQRRLEEEREEQLRYEAEEAERIKREREEELRYQQEEAERVRREREEELRYQQEEAERVRREREEELRYQQEKAERVRREREEELRYQQEEAERVRREREEQLQFEQDEAIRIAEEKLAKERKQRRIEAERAEEARRLRYQQEQEQEEEEDDDDDQPLTKEQELAKAEEKIRAAFAGLAQERSNLAQQALPQQAPGAFPIPSAASVPRQEEQRRPSISSNNGRSIRPVNRGTRVERGGQSVDIKMGRDRGPEVGVARYNTVGARSNGPPRGLPNGPRGGVGLPGGPRAGLPNGPRPGVKA